MFHDAAYDCPVEPGNLREIEAALDAKTPIGASVGFSCFEVQRLNYAIKKPGDVDEGRAEVRDQAHEFTSAFKQSC